MKRIETVAAGWMARWYDDEEPGGRFVAVRQVEASVAESDWTESDVEAATIDDAGDLARTLIAEIEDAQRDKAAHYDR